MELSAEQINALWKEANKQIAMDYLNQKSNENHLTDDEIQKMLNEFDDQKTWRGKLTKLSKNFAQSLNPKYIKEQRAKRREDYERYKAELKAHYGLSDAEARKTLREFNYLNSWRGKVVNKLCDMGQEIKMRYFPQRPQSQSLTNAEIKAMLMSTDLQQGQNGDAEVAKEQASIPGVDTTALSRKEGNTSNTDANVQPEREM